MGGTEPQALSVSIAHVKSHVGCDEPPTIPGTITWRKNRGSGSFRKTTKDSSMAQDAWAVFVLRPFSSLFQSIHHLKQIKSLGNKQAPMLRSGETQERRVSGIREQDERGKKEAFQEITPREAIRIVPILRRL